MDVAHNAAFKKEFETSFNPTDCFLLSIRDFFVVSIDQILKQFDFTDPAYEVIELLKPRNAKQLSPPTLYRLFERFPILYDSCNVDEAEREWRSHSNLPLELFNVSSQSALFELSAESYWKKVIEVKLPTGELKFPNLKICISLLLCLPFSNAPSERVFSAMKLTKTPLRNKLDDKTVDAIVQTKSWLKNQGESASNVEIPKALIVSAQRVKSNAPIIR